MSSSAFGSALIVLTEISIYVIIAVFTGLLAYNKIGIRPFRRGFYCDDQSISYPYREDTVSDSVLIVSFVLAPVIIIAVTEVIHSLISKKKKEQRGKDTFITLTINVYRAVGAFLFGSTVALFLSEVMKVSGGRLRPHFLSVCNLNYSRIDCSLGYVEISDEDCINTDEQKLIDARKSFPSGHATTAGFGAVYLIVYLYYRFTWPRRVRIFVPTVQMLIACAAAFVSISRVSDNKHHFSDVIAGDVLGFTVAILIFYFVSCVRKTAKEAAKEHAAAEITPQWTPHSGTNSIPSTTIEIKAYK